MPCPNLRLPHHHPLLLEVFTRVWLRDLSKAAGKTLTLTQIPDVILDGWAAAGFDAIWLMGVWATGARGKEEALRLHGLRREYEAALPGWTEDDVVGSPYAVSDFVVHPELGGPDALAHLRKRLHQRNLALWLDVVPNHTAWDHPWVKTWPQHYVHLKDGSLAAGKDPYFAPWTDTAQLDHRNLETQDALTAAVLEVAQQCDGVRCDMAMLVLPEVFEKTWAHAARPQGTPTGRNLWAHLIPAVRKSYPNFAFMAEAYWGLEFRLQLLGFDYTYDKTLYDRLMKADAPGIQAHLNAAPEYQARSVRFTENHDEPRVAARLGALASQAATVAALTVPGLRFLHEGQMEGRRVKVPVQLARRPEEQIDAQSMVLHQKLLKALQHVALRAGTFVCLAPNRHGVLAHRWQHPAGAVLVVVNLLGEAVETRMMVPLHGAAGRNVVLRCQLTGRMLEARGDDITNPAAGLSLMLQPHAAHIFAVDP